MKLKTLLPSALAWLCAGSLAAFGTASSVRAAEIPTENYGIRILPAPKEMKIDGKFDDWNLVGGVFASNDPGKMVDDLAVWVHAAYDENNLYILARWIDKTPMSNPGDSRLDAGWGGDCLQIRLITNEGTPREFASAVNGWIDRNGRDVVELQAPEANVNSPGGENLYQTTGAKQAFLKNADGGGYTQEIAVPWARLTKDGKAPKAGEKVIFSVEPNFDYGRNHFRVTVKDIFRPGAPIDRVFTFRATRNWGVGELVTPEQVAALEPRPVRLADNRTFPVKMENGAPVVDWKGLVLEKERPGFLPITFKLEQPGYVSLHIKNSDGAVVRQLLTGELFTAGEHTVPWDGLATGDWQKPGATLPEGDYSWAAITHPGLRLKFRGFASNGGTVPWDNGQGTNWGGDMGAPMSIATEGDKVIIGWNCGEAAKGTMLCDLDGKPVWGHKRGGIGGARFVALDGGEAFMIDTVGYTQLPAVVYKLTSAAGSVSTWTSTNGTERYVTELMGDTPEKAPKGTGGFYDIPQGFAVGGGKLYLASSSHQFSRQDVGPIRPLAAKASAEPDDALWKRLPDWCQRRLTAWLKTDEGEDIGLKGFPSVRDQITRTLNELLAELIAAELPEVKKGAQKGETVSAAQRAETNRHWLEARYPSIIARTTNFVAVADAVTGKAEGRIALPGAGALAATKKGVYAVANNDTLVFVDPAKKGAKQVTVVLKNLKNAQAVGVAPTGELYIGLGEPSNQVAVYAATGSPDRKPLRTIGKPGGRAATGVWDGTALRGISGLTVDEKGQLWIAENVTPPRRFSCWEAKSGKLLKEFFGSTQYGASGGAIHPDDPNIMIGEASEWRIDPATGRGACTGIFDTVEHTFARFVKAGGHTYIAVTQPDRAIPNAELRIYERLAEGDYRLRAKITAVKPDPKAKTPGRTEFWADANDDQTVQPEEVQVFAQQLTLGGYYLWSMNLADDMTFTGGVVPDKNGPGAAAQRKAVQIKPGSFTKCHAPVFDVAGAKTLADSVAPFNSGLPSRDGKTLLAYSSTGWEDGAIRGIDVASGKVLWHYANQWAGVHGSHAAPAPEAGLFRGVFGVIGTARLPAPVGDIWGFNSNVGEWHLLTGSGFYLSRLFQPDPVKIEYPETAAPGVDITDIPPGLGGEDFGGSLTQGADGKVYIQAGKTALWNVELLGLENVKAIPGGKLTLDAEGLKRAITDREARLQKSSEARRLEVKQLTPKFTGNLNADFKGAAIADYQKTPETAVRTALAWDDATLYVGWEVKDPTPWLNHADLPQFMYARGDTVDLQLATNPALDPKRDEGKLGDLRLSIGHLADAEQPIAILYRKESAEKKPMTFSSGVIHSYPMDYVQVLEGAHIEVKKSASGYTVEAAIPLAALGLSPKDGLAIRGDVGVTHSDPSGKDTRLRTYWSNQQTGLVDDEVFELKMEPKNWGELIFVK